GTYHPLPRNVEEELLKIAQEAITNAVRHSGADRVDVELRFSSTVRLSVRDNGRGFDRGAYAAGKNGHFGLLGMQERAHKIHARLDINSAPDQGTEVAVEGELRELENLR